MTGSERRQRRLLAVRELEADLAAAHLRVLRGEQQDMRHSLAQWQGLMRVDAGAAHREWLLACAEQELAAVHAGHLLQQIDRHTQRIEEQAAEERERRTAREQMQRLCDRTAESARLAESRMEQGRLDDIFSANRLGRMAESDSRTAS